MTGGGLRGGEGNTELVGGGGMGQEGKFGEKHVGFGAFDLPARRRQGPDG